MRRGDRIRTCDPLVPNQVRYQLRYAPRLSFNRVQKYAFFANLPNLLRDFFQKLLKFDGF